MSLKAVRTQTKVSAYRSHYAKHALVRALAVVSLAWGALALAQVPNKPITLLVPFAAGGNLDIVARLIAPGLAKQLGQAVVVQNKPGAGGVLGVTELARAEPDGSVLMVSTPNAITVAPKMMKTPYTIESFATVGLIATTSLLLVTRTEQAKFNDFASFVAYAKANPGKVTVGNAGIGTSNHLAIMQLQNIAGIELNVITYKGSGPANIDLLGGQIDAMIDQLSSAIPQLKSGRSRALVVVARARDPLVPDVPSTTDVGLPELEVSTTAGLLAPGKTPAATIALLNSALNQVLVDPTLREQFTRAASQVRPGPAAAFMTLMEKEDKQAAELAAAGKLKSE
jgi:tripartite-type tricarboxylate transporter receptor subunit TctC